MNRSKDLRRLFRESQKRERSVVTSSNYACEPHVPLGRYYQSEIEFPKDITIYFYEWSNVNSSPRCFYSLEVFELYLKRCGIAIELYQRDIINNLGKVYISCLTGTKLLSIRSSHSALCESMRSHDGKHLLNGVISKSLNGSLIKPPQLIFETKNTYFDNDGTFFG